MNQAVLKLCIFAAALIACVAGSVPAQFADENEEIYENPLESESYNVMEKRTRGLDPIAGVSFGSIKKRIDTLRGGSFGSQKRSDNLLGADIPTDQSSQSKILRSFIRKNMGLNEREGGIAIDRPAIIGSAFAGLPKKTPYPYYLQSIPLYLRVRDKGI